MWKVNDALHTAVPTQSSATKIVRKSTQTLVFHITKTLGTLTMPRGTVNLNHPVFSIITVNLNNREGLNRTVESVRKQSFQSWELLVVDGKSVDGSLDGLETSVDSRIHISSEIDNGIYDAMNKGIARAKGLFLIFLNSGDSFYNSEVLRQIRPYTNGSKNLIYGDVLISSTRGDLTLMTQPSILTQHRFLRRTLCHQSCFFSRSLFSEFGSYDTRFKLAADYEFLLRIFFRGAARYLHAGIPICIYEGGGISDLPMNRQQLTEEKRRALDQVVSRPRQRLISLTHSALSLLRK